MKIAIDLGGTNIRVGVIDEGKVVRKISKPCPSKGSEEEVLTFLINMIEEEAQQQFEGIGIGVPSVVDTEHGIVYNVSNIPSWKEVYLKDILQQKFNVPVFVNNDSNCFALGEKLFGECISYSNIIGITLGTGVGAGVIIDGKLYNGVNTGAGEIGSLAYLDSDYEHYCSSDFFVRYYNTTGQEVYKKACAADSDALAIWNEIGTHLGNLMKVVLYTYDPEAIVLGGGIATAYPFFSESMLTSMSDFPYKKIVDNVKILISKKEDISLLGASALVV
ncbi:ROK family protein [uncultured Bacteroides sp.]|uniref:ROK family protein n=1 Tax=uncultured Bacteroides sp. TaxID=162156 RepID=UPI002AA8C2AF|nr:ROK family protein [uncultured Bacteroides sp.]